MSQATAQAKTPGVARRFMAMFYDSLLALGVIFVFTLAVVLISGGEAVAAGSIWFTISVLAVLFVYFGWAWTHGGQTLGMRSWRMQVTRPDGKRLDWLDALKRYLVSWLVLLPALLGLWWAWLDRDGITLQDRLSGTRTVLLPNP